MCPQFVRNLLIGAEVLDLEDLGPVHQTVVHFVVHGPDGTEGNLGRPHDLVAGGDTALEEPYGRPVTVGDVHGRAGHLEDDLLEVQGTGERAPDLLDLLRLAAAAVQLTQAAGVGDGDGRQIRNPLQQLDVVRGVGVGLVALGADGPDHLIVDQQWSRNRRAGHVGVLIAQEHDRLLVQPVLNHGRLSGANDFAVTPRIDDVTPAHVPLVRIEDHPGQFGLRVVEGDIKTTRLEDLGRFFINGPVQVLDGEGSGECAANLEEDSVAVPQRRAGRRD